MNSGGNKNNNLGLNNYDQQDTSYNTYGLSPSFLASLRIQGPLHNKVFVANVSIIRKMLNNQFNIQPTKKQKSLILLISVHSHTHSLCLSLSLFLAPSAIALSERVHFSLNHIEGVSMHFLFLWLMLSLVVPFSSVLRDFFATISRRFHMMSDDDITAFAFNSVLN